jgi:hypothetical protein
MRRPDTAALIIFRKARRYLIPEHLRNDCFVQTWVRLSLMDDLPDVDAIVQEMVEGTPRVWRVPRGSPSRTDASLAADSLTVQVIFELPGAPEA